MDATPFQDLKIAPLAVFDSLAERRSRPRFMLPAPDGDWRAVTWGAFAKQIREAAMFCASVGLRAGERACVYAPNRVEWMSAALGIQAAGGVMVPVYPSSTAEQAAFVVDHSDARIVFVDTAPLLARLFTVWESLGAIERVVVLDEAIDASVVADDLRAKGKPAPSAAEVERKVLSWPRALAEGRSFDAQDPLAFDRTMRAVPLDQPGLMLYTSGTSGNPKGVPLTHRNVAVNGREWLVSNAPLIEPGDVDLLWLPMSHIFGYGETCLGNTLGFTSYLVDPRALLEQLPVVRPNILMSVPSVWEKLATTAMAAPTAEGQRERLRELTGGALRFCLSGGAGLKREIKEFFHAQGTLVLEGYGLTETSPTLTINAPAAYRFDTVGRPLPSVELRLADDGEILARGPSVFGGYHKDPAATAEAFTPDGWFKTGDVGRFTEDGFLQIIDRKKDILVTAGGKNVPPANIERRFADDPLFAHVVVFGEGKKYLVAGVWLNDAAVTEHFARRSIEASEHAVRALVEERIERVNAELASYETLKKFAILRTPLSVEAGTLTPTMKIRRKKIAEVFGSTLDALYHS